MTLFFLAYTASNNIKTIKGYRVFEIEAYTSAEIAKALEEKLDSIRYEINMNEIVATAFNKIQYYIRSDEKPAIGGLLFVYTFQQATLCATLKNNF